MPSLSQEAIHALQMARQSELDTVQIYEHMIRQAGNSNTKDIFGRLIDEEHKHAKEIEDRLVAGGGEIPHPQADIEVPDRKQIMEIELQNCTVSELINLAIENERISRDFYKAQFDRANNGDVREIFDWLVSQEDDHIQKLKEEYEAHRNYEEVRFSDRKSKD